MPEFPKDKRLEQLKHGDYRMWHDSQQVRVPQYQSENHPNRPVDVPVNVRVRGDIQMGYFMPPQVSFDNQEVNRKRFDEWTFRIFRKIFPPDIDINEILNLTEIKLLIDLNINLTGNDFNLNEEKTFTANFNDVITLNFANGYFSSQPIKTKANGLNKLSGYGIFVLSKEELPIQLIMPNFASNYHLYLDLFDVENHVGNSNYFVDYEVLDSAQPRFSVEYFLNNLEVVGGSNG